jgi:hypothetical protein
MNISSMPLIPRTRMRRCRRVGIEPDGCAAERCLPALAAEAVVCGAVPAAAARCDVQYARHATRNAQHTQRATCVAALRASSSSSTVPLTMPHSITCTPQLRDAERSAQHERGLHSASACSVGSHLPRRFSPGYSQPANHCILLSATSSPGLGPIFAGTRPHLRRDSATSSPGLICAETALARCAGDLEAEVFDLLHAGGYDGTQPPPRSTAAACRTQRRPL